ncbi:hypothetical protein FOA52_006517 [Chlamydomonas sp. UWO 241]|nr:hypothetical protein FOA52_006517 [Chlamydomonas sp. UWO 241]
MKKANASAPLLEQLGKTLASEGDEIAGRVKGLIVFNIDGDEWTADLRKDVPEGTQRLVQGVPTDKPDLTLTVSDANFVQLVMGKLNPQTAFLMRKIKIAGSMGMAMKLQPILDAAQPKAKM